MGRKHTHNLLASSSLLCHDAINLSAPNRTPVYHGTPFFHLTFSRWTSSLQSCLWSLRIFPSLPGSRLTIFYRDASSAILQPVNQWLNFTYSRSHAFRYERKNTYPILVRIELTTSALASVQVTYTRPLGRRARSAQKLGNKHSNGVRVE